MGRPSDALIKALKDKGFTIPDEVETYSDLVIAIKANDLGGGSDDPYDRFGGGGDYDDDPSAAYRGHQPMVS